MLEDFEIELLCDKLRLGAPIEVAARAIGLLPAEVVGYLQVGRDPTKTKAHKFRSKVMEAIANCELKDLETIEKSADWRAAAWRLSRRFPHRWGDKIALDVAVAPKQDALNPWTATLKPPDLGPMLGAHKINTLPSPGENDTDGSSNVVEAEILED